MKTLIKITTILLILNSLIIANNESTTINDENKFFYTIMDDLNNVNAEYDLNIEAMVRISENGEFSYKIVKYSEIPKFNTHIENFLEERKKIIFPNLNKKAKKFKITFKAENSNKKPELKNIQESK